MKTATEINRDYKIQKKIEALEKKKQKMIQKHKVSLEAKRQKAIDDANSSISARYNKQLLRYEKQRQKTLEREKRKLLGKKSLKKNQKQTISLTKLKKQVFADFQWCIRFDDKDAGGFVIPIDKPREKRQRNDRIDAGHFYPKHNYPHLIFNKDNVFPQTKHGNRMQLDGKGTYDEEIIIRIGLKRYEALKILADNKAEKQKAIRLQSNRSYWEELRKYWKKEKSERLKKYKK